MLYDDKRWDKSPSVDERHKVLDGAIRYILRFGWRQEGLGRYGEPRCAAGAIFSVTGGENQLSFATFAVIHRLVVRLPYWNDAPGRTKEEVVDLFKRAQALLLEGAQDCERNRT